MRAASPAGLAPDLTRRPRFLSMMRLGRPSAKSARSRLLPVVMGLGLVAVVATVASAAPTFSATASMTPHVQYLNDRAGTVFAFTVFNTGDTRFAAVEIARPSPSWVVLSCPRAPVGWRTERHVWGCRYRSRATAADDIPGHSSNANFRLKATVRAGSANIVGRWTVVVSRTTSFSDSRNLRSAPPLSPGLRMVANSFQVLDAVLVASPRAIGSACPVPTAANHSSITGTTGQTIAICGRNRTNTARTPNAAHSSLGGTFIASHGGFSSGSIRANSGNVVLGNWANVTITSSPGTGKSVAARIGSAATRTSPLTTRTGYAAVNPVNHQPVVNPATFTIPENSPIGTAVGTATFSDVNTGQTHVFNIQGGDPTGAFAINASSGAISVANSAGLNFETTPSFSLTIRVTDNGTPVLFGQATVTVNLTDANDAPVVTTTGGQNTYTENGPAVVIDGALTVSDSDDTNLEGGRVRISANFQAGDNLVFANQPGITGSYNSGTGVLTLTGTSLVANYQASLRSVGFSSTNDDPAVQRTIAFRVNDGSVDSTEATKGVTITPVNDRPIITPTVAHLIYTEGDGAKAVDAGLTVTDPDSANLIAGSVAITSNFVSADDELAFVNQSGITGSYSDISGVLTMTGTASLADYQAALRSVTYTNSSQNPAGSKSVNFQFADGDGGINTIALRRIDLIGVNDAPTVTTSAGGTTVLVVGPATVIDGALSVSDPDDANIEGGVVRISAGFEANDGLGFTAQNGISGSYNPGTGVLTLTGTASLADYQTALRSVTFRHDFDVLSDPPPGPSRTIAFKVNDGDVDSAEATKVLAIIV